MSKSSEALAQVLDNVIRLSDWEQSKFLRFTIRMANKDLKAQRLADMYLSGQISRSQFFISM